MHQARACSQSCPRAEHLANGLALSEAAQSALLVLVLPDLPSLCVRSSAPLSDNTVLLQQHFLHMHTGVQVHCKGATQVIYVLAVAVCFAALEAISHTLHKWQGSSSALSARLLTNHADA